VEGFAVSKKQTVYLESSVISYQANEISNDIKTAAEQMITRQWWENKLHKFEPYISDYVIFEVKRGRKIDSERRSTLASHFPILPDNKEILNLAGEYIKKLSLPKDGQIDAFHIAFATVYEIDFLVSWNCKHIANAMKFPLIRKINQSKGLWVPVICTPRELSGD